jgi:hypothetical protein
MTGQRLDWPAILERAADITMSYATPVTLRQVFYRLVAAQVLPNRLSAYNRLGRLSARARRDGWFPRLLDQGRTISRPPSFDSPAKARQWLARFYRRDRTEGQLYNVYIGAEKATMTPQLDEWFGDRGLPVVTLRGYSGQELVTDVADDITVSDRPAALLYAGDFDPSGVDILRDFTNRVGFDKVIRVALNEDQVVGLPVAVGKAEDPRAPSFVAQFGRLVQVELEALDPAVLQSLYEDALAGLWDDAAYRAVLAAEEDDRRQL